MTDFQAAAAILNGKTVKIDTFVVPATTRSRARAGDRDDRRQDAARRSSSRPARRSATPVCAACLGGPSDTFGRLNTPISCISTTNRNFPGRMGHKEAKVFLASR